MRLKHTDLSLPSRGDQRLQAGLLTLGHGITDTYAAFPAPLWPLLSSTLGLSLTLVSLSNSVMYISTSFLQPLYGYLADKTRWRVFTVAGPGVSALFMSLIGLAPSYPALLLLLVLGGVGIGAFHPQAAATVGKGQYRSRGLAISIFLTGGALGFAVGPLIASSFVSRYGLANTYVLAWPGLIVSALLYVFLPIPLSTLPHVGLSSMFVHMRRRLRPLSTLFAVAVLRSSVYIGLVTFLPFLLLKRGLSLVEAGGTVSLFLLSASIGGLAGGALSDRIDPTKLIMGSLAASALFLALLVRTDDRGLQFLMLLPLASAALAVSNPLTVALAQELLPDSVNTASALMMGSSWGTGGLIAISFGYFADSFGLEAMLGGLACLPAAAALLTLPLFGQAGSMRSERRIAGPAGPEPRPS